MVLPILAGQGSGPVTIGAPEWSLNSSGLDRGCEAGGFQSRDVAGKDVADAGGRRPRRVIGSGHRGVALAHAVDHVLLDGLAVA